MRRWRNEGIWVLLVLALAGTLFIGRQQGPQRITHADTYWYLLFAQEFAGTQPEVAAAEAAKLLCQDRNRSAQELRLPDRCLSYHGISNPRYVAIFSGRPGYPLFAAPLVKMLGPWRGMAAATFLLGLAAALLAYAGVRFVSGSPVAGVAAAALLYVLPSGYWLTRFLPESMIFACILAALLAVALLWSGRLRAGFVILVSALVVLFATKSANGAVTAAALTGVGLVCLPVRNRPCTLCHGTGRRGVGALLRPRDSEERCIQCGGSGRGVDPRPGLLLTGVGLVSLVGWFALSIALGLAGLNTALQDLATAHFTRPDVADPVGFMLRLDRGVLRRIATDIMASPWTLVLVVFAAAALLCSWRFLGLAWVACGLAGIGLVLVHPVTSVYPRLIDPIWITVAAGLGLAIGMAWDAVRERFFLPRRLSP